MSLPHDTEGSSPTHLDTHRWDQLIESIGPDSMLVILNHAMSERLKKHLAAEDIWQETLWHAWRDREKHEWVDRKNYKWWLLAIARNRIRDAVDHLDAQKRGGGNAAIEFSSLLASSDGAISQLLPGRSTTPSRIASARERAELMESVLGSLSDDQQAVVRLYLFEEQPMESVASELGIPVSTAWYRFRRGAEEYARKLAELERTRP